jgi:hypothetical protein
MGMGRGRSYARWLFPRAHYRRRGKKRMSQVVAEAYIRPPPAPDTSWPH